MPEQMMSWESDEAQDWESDEAFAESDESAEDIGERARRRWRGRGPYRPAYARGVQGIRTPSGPVAFPQRLTTAAETNRGLAAQERARNELEKQVDQLERRFQQQRKSDASVSGIVTLVIGGGLTVLGIVLARQAITFNSWASQEPVKAAATVSGFQLANTLAKSAVGAGGGRYASSGSPLGIAADVFAVAQLAAFAFGTLNIPTAGVQKQPKIVVGTKDTLNTNDPTLQPNDIVVTDGDHRTWELIADSAGHKAFRSVRPETEL
jgi:hypothetical protein